jgi:DNA-binding Lrp family transcriptional regulator
MEYLRRKRVRIVATLRGLEDGTLWIVQEKGHATPREVADRLGITLAAANNRLARLVEAGVLLRERVPVGPPTGGHFFRYLNPPRGEGTDPAEWVELGVVVQEQKGRAS